MSQPAGMAKQPRACPALLASSARWLPPELEEWELMLFDVSGEDAGAWGKPKTTLAGSRHVLHASEVPAGRVKTLLRKGGVLKKGDHGNVGNIRHRQQINPSLCRANMGVSAVEDPGALQPEQ